MWRAGSSACYLLGLRAIIQRNYTRQGLSFEQFQAGTAARRDVCHLVSQSSLLYGCCRISAADDGDNTFGRQVREYLCNGIRTFGKGGHLKNAHWAIPDKGFVIAQNLAKLLHRFGADVQDFPAVGYILGTG